MCILYRGLSIDTYYQVFDSFGPVVSEEKIFRNRPIRNQNCLLWPGLLTNQDDMSNFIDDLP